MMGLYKHNNNTDVAVDVLKQFYIKEKDAYSMKVMWWNIGPHEPYCMHITQRLRIPREVWLRDWASYEPQKEKE